jgi:hypothetical protein
MRELLTLRRLTLLTLLLGLLAACTSGTEGEGPLQVRDVEIGEPALGDSNIFRARVTNRADTALLVVLDLRATPGMWFRPNWQRQYGFELAGLESRSIEAPYSFGRMSPEAQLRVRLGPGRTTAEGFSIDTITYERRFSVAEGNPAAIDVEGSFDLVVEGPLEIYAWKGSLAARRAEDIAAQRVGAIEEIAALLDVAPPERIHLVLYPDSATKTGQTGHIGAGWASGTTIVEIYNEELQLDPFHELSHVLTYELGDPPAVLDEGFATYVSERLGADALAYMGSSGLTVNEAACRALEAGKAHSVERLVALEEIGSVESRAEVAYPQAASLVKFLLERYGVESFRQVFRLAAEAEGTAGDRTRGALEQVLGVGLGELETEWKAEIAPACAD